MNTSLYAQLSVLTTTSLSGDPLIDPNFLNNGNYAVDTNNERDQYVGLWRYQTPEILLEIKMEKKDQQIFRMQNSSGQTDYYYYIDVLIIKYRLVKNSLEVYNNLNENLNSNYNYKWFVFKQGINNFANGRMQDFTRQVNASLNITKLNTNPEKIIFDLSSGIYRLEGPDELYQPSVKLFDLPTDGIEMVRVN